MDISTTFSALSVAIDSVRRLRDVNNALSSAELNNLVADLLDSLANVKMDLAEVKSELALKDSRILKLEGELELLNETKYAHEKIFLTGDDDPFCPVCFERDSKLIHLRASIYRKSQGYGCPSCGYFTYNELLLV
ncbi:hypothetical protein HF888_16480 (plasmid) [Bermanella marisrubri]|uniref:Uncharacterized protein n=1 Tax=Bermanella marisrubri TaxID=207949 RepID=Q1MY09_9GAMM|nr:hypothetical protein [Bermanella marisrubri]EAT10887.1 hypothetical protein RED65_02073 [Oceanobacter sp. RED65] [Bermanella marisrubri]QIZ85937.1 hypothetical protein HF888_16480 [Bermanella marisrubri]